MVPVMPFCQNCGQKVKDEDVFCGNCGSKILKPSKEAPGLLNRSSIMGGFKQISERAREKTAEIRSEIDERSQSMDLTKSAEDTISSIRDVATKEDSFSKNASKLDPYARVFTWVINTHVNPIKELAKGIASHMSSFNCIEGDRLRLDWGQGCPANLENLLMYLPHVEVGLKNISDFAVVKEGVNLTKDEAYSLRYWLEETVKAYTSTKEAVNDLYKATNPIDKYLYEVAELSRKQDITNTRRLSKYEKAMSDFFKNIRKTDWSKYPQMDFFPILEKARSHSLQVISMEVKTNYHHVLYQYPYMGPLGYSTDVERYTAPFFTYIEELDESYNRCKDLFNRCKNTPGIRDQDNKLRIETVEALYAFNTQLHGFYSAHSYCYRAHLRLGWSGDIVPDGESIIKKIDRSSGKNQKMINAKDSREIIQNVYKYILMLNEVEPVTKSLAAYPW
jgi:hypothetical protein